MMISFAISCKNILLLQLAVDYKNMFDCDQRLSTSTLTSQELWSQIVIVIEDCLILLFLCHPIQCSVKLKSESSPEQIFVDSEVKQ